MKKISTFAILLWILTFSAAAQIPTNQQLSQLGLKNATLKELQQGIWTVKTAGKAAGHVISSAPYAGKIRGYQGTTPVLIYIDRTRKVQRIVALPCKETPSFFTPAKEILKKWQGLPAKRAAQTKVDAVSGATYSSRSLAGNVHAALEAYNQHVK